MSRETVRFRVSFCPTFGCSKITNKIAYRKLHVPETPRGQLMSVFVTIMSVCDVMAVKSSEKSADGSGQCMKMAAITQEDTDFLECELDDISLSQICIAMDYTYISMENRTKHTQVRFIYVYVLLR